MSATIEQRLQTIEDVLNQLAADLDLAVVNLRRALKTPQSGHKGEAGARSWDPQKITWTQDAGKKGPYEKAVDGPDYQELVEDLKKHEGKLNHDGRFYWLFTEQNAVGRTLPK